MSAAFLPSPPGCGLHAQSRARGTPGLRVCKTRHPRSRFPLMIDGGPGDPDDGPRRRDGEDRNAASGRRGGRGGGRASGISRDARQRVHDIVSFGAAESSNPPGPAGDGGGQSRKSQRFASRSSTAGGGTRRRGQSSRYARGNGRRRYSNDRGASEDRRWQGRGNGEQEEVGSERREPSSLNDGDRDDLVRDSGPSGDDGRRGRDVGGPANFVRGRGNSGISRGNGQVRRGTGRTYGSGGVRGARGGPSREVEAWIADDTSPELDSSEESRKPAGMGESGDRGNVDEGFFSRYRSRRSSDFADALEPGTIGRALRVSDRASSGDDEESDAAGGGGGSSDHAYDDVSEADSKDYMPKQALDGTRGSRAVNENARIPRAQTNEVSVFEDEEVDSAEENSRGGRQRSRPEMNPSEYGRQSVVGGERSSPPSTGFSSKGSSSHFRNLLGIARKGSERPGSRQRTRDVRTGSSSSRSGKPENDSSELSDSLPLPRGSQLISQLSVRATSEQAGQSKPDVSAKDQQSATELHGRVREKNFEYPRPNLVFDDLDDDAQETIDEDGRRQWKGNNNRGRPHRGKARGSLMPGVARPVFQPPVEWAPMDEVDILNLKSGQFSTSSSAQFRHEMTSVSDCSACRGTGLRNCTACGGEGWIPRPPADISKHDTLPYKVRAVWDLPDLVIDRSGRAQCPFCNGRGRAFCDVCEGSGSSLRKGFDMEREREELFGIPINPNRDWDSIISYYVDEDDEETPDVDEEIDDSIHDVDFSPGFGVHRAQETSDDVDDELMLYEGDGDLDDLLTYSLEDDDDDEDEDDVDVGDEDEAETAFGDDSTEVAGTTEALISQAEPLGTLHSAEDGTFLMDSSVVVNDDEDDEDVDDDDDYADFNAASGRISRR